MRTVIWVVLLFFHVVAGYTQGQVSFVNTPNTFTTTATMAVNGHTDRLVYSWDNVTPLSGTNWVAQLYYAAGANQPDMSLHVILGDTATPFRVGPVGGGFGTDGERKRLPTLVQVKSQLYRSGFGTVPYLEATLLRLLLEDLRGDRLPSTMMAPMAPSTAFAMEGLQSFTLGIPEPSTSVLGCLGAAGLYLYWRFNGKRTLSYVATLILFRFLLLLSDHPIPF